MTTTKLIGPQPRKRDLHLTRTLDFSTNVSHDDDYNKTSQIFIFDNGKTVVLHASQVLFFVLHFAVVHILLALDNIGWSRTEWKSCFLLSLMSSSSSCDRNKYNGIRRRSSTSYRDALSLYLWTSISLSLLHEPYSAIFISVTRGRRWHQRHRKTRFLFGSTSPYTI